MNWLMSKLETIQTGFNAKRNWPQNGLDIRRVDYLYKEAIKALFELGIIVTGVYIVWYVIFLR